MATHVQRRRCSPRTAGGSGRSRLRTAMSAERIESQGFFEMLWDCDHCGTKGLLGEVAAPLRGVRRAAEPRQALLPDARAAAAGRGHTYVGADLHCPSCKSPMGAAAKNCTHCGSPMEGAREVASVEKARRAEAEDARIWPYVVAAIARARGRDLVPVHPLDHRAARRQGSTAGSARSRSRNSRTTRKRRGAIRCPRARACRRAIASSARRARCPTARTATPSATTRRTARSSRRAKCKPKYRSEGVDDDWCTFTVRSWSAGRQREGCRDRPGAGVAPELPPATTAAALGARRSGKRSEKLYPRLRRQGPVRGLRCGVAQVHRRHEVQGRGARALRRGRLWRPVASACGSGPCGGAAASLP